MIYALAYVSCASDDLTKTDIKNIFQFSVNWNLDHDISGFLIYNNHNFIQLLEGDKKEVDTLFSRIAVDNRHKHVLPFLRQELPYRAFDDYESGFLTSEGALHKELLQYLKYLKLLEDSNIDKTINTIEEILKASK